MGHLVNPVTFRLSKSKFWISVWNNYNKKNFKKYFLEDLNGFQFYKWLVRVINYSQIGVKVLDVNLIKTFRFFILNISVMFDEGHLIDVVQHADVVYKKFFFEKFLFKLYTWRVHNTYLIGDFKKIYNLHLNFRRKKEKTNLCYIKCYSSGFDNLVLQFFQKPEKVSSFLKKEYLKFFRMRWKMGPKRNGLVSKVSCKWVQDIVLKTTRVNTYLQRKWWRVLNNFVVSQHVWLSLEPKKEAFLPMRYILLFLKNFLEYYLKNLFSIKSMFLYFFEKTAYRFSTRYLKRFIKLEIHTKGYKVKHIINVIRKDLAADVSILGFKLGFFGRYQKKLRNKDFYRVNGSLAPSNLNSTVSYENFVVLLKQGICGIELSIMKKMKYNAIF